MDNIEISVVRLLLFIAFSLLPVFILLNRHRDIVKDLLVSTIRMVIQLFFVGIYLQFLFDNNLPLLNFGWVLVMIIVASFTVKSRSNIRVKNLFLTIFSVILLTTIVVGGVLLFTIGIEPIYDAHYLIPLIGMILGNSLQANVISLNSFYRDIKENRDIYELLLYNGASRKEALREFSDNSLRLALSPTIAAMMTIGLVSLPGMMTGQILGGTDPMGAIKYQIIIMMAIFLSIFFSVYLNIKLTPLAAFDSFGNLLDDKIE